jgi:hypothetical protein
MKSFLDSLECCGVDAHKAQILGEDMPFISGSALMMAIQAVDAKINEISKQMAEGCDIAGVGETDQLLLGYEKALQELQAGYEEALRTSSNLPPYELLVSR